MDEIEQKTISARIFKIRGQRVMLDMDLAKLYGVPVFRMNEAVRRNFKRFPADFLFKLTRFEWTNLISQSAISNSQRGGRRHSPYAFTEQGVAMLSSVLNSERAIQINIAIMRAFVKLRRAIGHDQYLAHKIEKMEGRLDLVETDIRLIIQNLEQMKKRPGPSGPINPSVL